MAGRVAKVAVSGAMLTAAVLIPVSSGARQSGPVNDPKDPVPPDTSKEVGMPQPTADDVQSAQALASVSDLRGILAARFPGVFAGEFNSGSRNADAFTILTVVGADDQALRQFVEAELAQLPPGAQRPSVQFETAPLSLQGLESLRDSVTKDAAYWSDQGIKVTAVGVDDLHNAIIVWVESPTAEMQNLFYEKYKTQAIRFEAGASFSFFTDRTNDSPPWNSGDAIKSAVNLDGCSSGFGIHNGATHWLTTAGHCPSGTWKNTTFDNPDMSLYNLVGATDLNVFASRIDAQRIAASSSHIFWKQTATREFVAASANPSVSNTVCSEGAKSFEKCGTVISVDIHPMGSPVDALFAVDMNPACSAGDSGGPMIWPTAFGYVAQGLVSGGPVGLPACLGTRINEVQFSLGGVVNTINNP